MADDADEPDEPDDERSRAGHVTVLRGAGDRVFHIVGTAHVSRRSVDEVREVIERVRPDTVCVELCRTRYEALTDETRWQRLDVFQVVRQGKMLFLLASLALQIFQRRIGEKLGVRPGEELLAGVQAARTVGAELVLADRDIQATLRRTWANLSFWNKTQLLGALLEGFFQHQEIDEAQVERLKERDYLSEVMAELAKAMPAVKEPLIDERDRFIMSAIEDSPGRTVVAVVGAGHVEGMVSHFGQRTDREALSRIPPPSPWSTALQWLIPIVVLGAFYWGYREHAGEGLMKMLLAWALPTALAAGLFTLVSGGKLLSVVVAVLASPLTALNPALVAGMPVGLTEAWLRRPTVQDCEQLGKRVASYRELYRNPFARVLIVALASSLGAALGSIAGATWVVTLI